MGRKVHVIKAGILHHGTGDILGQIIVCCGGLSHAVQDAYTLDAKGTSPLKLGPPKNVSRHCPVSPGSNLFPAENSCFKGLCEPFLKPKYRRQCPAIFSTCGAVAGNDWLESCQKNKALCSGHPHSNISWHCGNASVFS